MLFESEIRSRMPLMLVVEKGGKVCRADCGVSLGGELHDQTTLDTRTGATLGLHTHHHASSDTHRFAASGPSTNLFAPAVRLRAMPVCLHRAEHPYHPSAVLRPHHALCCADPTTSSLTTTLLQAARVPQIAASPAIPVSPAVVSLDGRLPAQQPQSDGMDEHPARAGQGAAEGR